MTVEEKIISLGERAVPILWDSSQKILSALAGIFFVISGLRLEKFPGGWFFWFGVVATMINIVTGVLQRPSRSELRQQAKGYKGRIEARNKELADAIKALARRMVSELGVDTTNTRITVYLHWTGYIGQKKCEGFVPVARYSNNPNLAKPGKKFHDDSHGAIAATWQTGFYFKDDYPADEDEWVERATSENLPLCREDAKKIRMKSVCIAGTRLDHDNHSVGVIIIESVKKWVDTNVSDRIAEEAGDFVDLRDTAAEIIYIVRNSFDGTPEPAELPSRDPELD